MSTEASAASPVMPVNHVVDDGAITIRSHEGAAIVAAASAVDGVVIAYEADTIDPDDHLGWSVIVTGLARLITDPAEIARFQAVIRPWAAGQMDFVIRIIPQIVTGFRLTSAEGTNADGGGRS
jgi:hypothetical protein